MKKVMFFLIVIVSTQSFGQKQKNLGPYLKTFNVVKENDQNVVTWTTTNEEGVAWFLLERSLGDGNYTGACIYSSGELHKKSYQFKDGKRFNRAVSYRIIIKGSQDNILDIRYIFIKVRLPEKKSKEIPYFVRDFLLSP